MAQLANEGNDLEAQSGGPRCSEDVRESEAHELSSHQSEDIIREPAREFEAEAGKEADSFAPQQTPTDASSLGMGANSQTRDSTDGVTPAKGSCARRMIGDFDDSANALWSLHEKEVKGHDEARIQSLKDDMDGVLIFAGLFSASLTSFIIDKIRSLQVDPAQQAVYYNQQSVVLLAQISQQLSSLAPQVLIPSTPPPPYPAFTPSSSDIRVNAYWFMSLIFSLTAALLATLVQQWVRDYMHVFQRYSHPLKSARLRQYLWEGVDGWYMPVVAESVPALVHVSLFLFFLGLGDSLLNLNTTIGVTTIIPITLCGFLYILITFMPVIYPQSPYQNSFSALIWYLTQKVHIRRYVDRASGGARKPVSSNMARGQMQLAMEETDARKHRDVRSIQWLISNLTEDIEMESFVLAIPGSFSTEWGIEVWRKVLEIKENEPTILPSDGASQTGSNHHAPTLPHATLSLSRHIGLPPNVFGPIRRLITMHNSNTSTGEVDGPHTVGQVPDVPSSNGDFSIRELYDHVHHLFETCNDRGLFTNEDAWRRRARGCVETVASLVCCAKAELRVFGDIEILLNSLGGVENVRASSVAGSDPSFVTRWTCLSLVAIRGMLDKDKNSQVLRERSGNVIQALSRLRMEGVKSDGNTEDENALTNARRIDEQFSTAKILCVKQWNRVLRNLEADATEEQTRDILRGYESMISDLEVIKIEADLTEEIDWSISVVDFTIRSLTSGLILQLPGVTFDDFLWVPSSPDQIFTFPGAVTVGGQVSPQWVFLRQRLRCLGSLGPKLRDIVEGRETADYQETFKHLRTICDTAHDNTSIANARHLMERQLWRLRDLRDGGGFGFTVELFFLSLRQLLSMSSSSDTFSTFYVGTFRAITSNWRQHKHSLGTQRVLLNLICDLAADQRGLFSDYPYPSYITDELLDLLGNVVEGQTGSHIDDAMEELRDYWSWIYGEEDDNLPGKAWRIIARTRAPVSSV